MEKNTLLYVQKLRQIPAVPESQEYCHNVAGPLLQRSKIQHVPENTKIVKKVLNVAHI